MTQSVRSIRWRPLIGILGGLLPASCSTAPDSSLPPWADRGAYGAAERVEQLSDGRIVEASGMAASRRVPGLFYVHNDSGDAARVFLVNRRGETVVTLELNGARNSDFEDIAIGPGSAAGSFDVCVADIGDNAGRRAEVAIYRFAEVGTDDIARGIDQVQTTAFHFQYEDGPRNAEGFIVHPITGDGYVLTKREDGQSDVYLLAAPWDSGGRVTVSRIASLNFPAATVPIVTMVTGADISPDGRRLSTRSYAGGWEWSLGADGGVEPFASIFETAPVGLPLALEPQGEAIAYAADGASILTVSEGLLPPLHEIRRIGEAR